MKKQTPEDFLLFQHEFRRWQKRFGLTGYHVYFKLEPLDGDFAGIVVNLNGMVVRVSLSSTIPADQVVDNDIKGLAKHEALHLLVDRLEQSARYRYTSNSEIHEAAEELVVRLGKLVR